MLIFYLYNLIRRLPDAVYIYKYKDNWMDSKKKVPIQSNINQYSSIEIYSRYNKGISNSFVTNVDITNYYIDEKFNDSHVLVYC